MNTPTKATNPGDKPAEQVLNTQSTKPVAPGGGATAVMDPDNPKNASAAPKIPDKGTGSTASDQAITNKEAGTQLGAAENPKSESDEEFEKALAEKDGVISAQDQAAIDAAHGASPEIERGDKNYIQAAAHSSHDSLESDVRTIQERDRNIRPRLERFCADNESPVSVITKLVRDIPADTPDDHIVWGASGHKLRMGHLRALVMGVGHR